MINNALKIYKKYEELINYVIVGSLTTVVGITSYSLFRFVLLKSLVTAEVLSWIIAVIFAYVTNKIFVFKSKKKKILKEIFNFFSARILTLIIGIFILMFLEWVVPVNEFWQMIAKIMQQIIVLGLNYILSKLIVFKKEI